MADEKDPSKPVKQTDWTIDPNNPSKNSPQFLAIADSIADMIKGSASELLSGDVVRVSQKILNQLATRKHLVPNGYAGLVIIEADEAKDGKLRGRLAYHGQILDFTSSVPRVDTPSV